MADVAGLEGFTFSKCELVHFRLENTLSKGSGTSYIPMTTFASKGHIGVAKLLAKPAWPAPASFFWPSFLNHQPVSFIPALFSD